MNQLFRLLIFLTLLLLLPGAQASPTPTESPHAIVDLPDFNVDESTKIEIPDVVALVISAFGGTATVRQFLLLIQDWQKSRIKEGEHNRNIEMEKVRGENEERKQENTQLIKLIEIIAESSRATQQLNERAANERAEARQNQAAQTTAIQNLTAAVHNHTTKIDAGINTIIDGVTRLQHNITSLIDLIDTSSDKALKPVSQHLKHAQESVVQAINTVQVTEAQNQPDKDKHDE